MKKRFFYEKCCSSDAIKTCIIKTGKSVILDKLEKLFFFSIYDIRNCIIKVQKRKLFCCKFYRFCFKLYSLYYICNFKKEKYNSIKMFIYFFWVFKPMQSALSLSNGKLFTIFSQFNFNLIWFDFSNCNNIIKLTILNVCFFLLVLFPFKF